MHLVSDAHQPMHINLAEGKGGNTTKLFFEVKATNLHVLWDSKLIDYQELPYVAMTKNYDAADTPADKTVAERRYDGLAI